MNNTLTPWTASEYAVLDADNNVICIAIDGTDAAQIVLAVNNHSRLVATVEALIEAAEDGTPCLCGDDISAARRLLNDLTA